MMPIFYIFGAIHMKKLFLLRIFLGLFCLVINGSENAPESTPEKTHELDPQARTVINHIFNLLADGYVIISSAASSIVKDAAILDVIRRVEELFAYVVSDKKRSPHQEEVAQLIAVLLRDEKFVELLTKAAHEKEKSQIHVL